MAHHDALYIEHSDPSAVAEAIADWERAGGRRVRVRGVGLAGAADRPGGWAPLKAVSYVYRAEAPGWTVVFTNRCTWNCEGLLTTLSQRLRGRVFGVSWETVCGQSCFIFAEFGHLRRSIWYTRGLEIHQEAGDPLPLEVEALGDPSKPRAEELADELALEGEALRAYRLPTAEQLAEAFAVPVLLDPRGQPPAARVSARRWWWPL